MAFKLTKAELTQREILRVKLDEARADLDRRVEDVNDAAQTAHDALEQAVAEYNEILSEARGFVEDISAVANEDFEDKSERWQESERGEICRAWADEWEQADLTDIELPAMERIELDAEDHAAILEDLPMEAE